MKNKSKYIIKEIRLKDSTIYKQVRRTAMGRFVEFITGVTYKQNKDIKRLNAFCDKQAIEESFDSIIKHYHESTKKTSGGYIKRYLYNLNDIEYLIYIERFIDEEDGSGITSGFLRDDGNAGYTDIGIFNDMSTKESFGIMSTVLKFIDDEIKLERTDIITIQANERRKLSMYLKLMKRLQGKYKGTLRFNDSTSISIVIKNEGKEYINAERANNFVELSIKKMKKYGKRMKGK